MSEQSFPDFTAKKAYEIGYALCRIAAGSGRSTLAERLEQEAFNLAADAAARQYGRVMASLAAIEHMLRLAADTNILHQNSATLVIQEARALNSAIAEFQHSAAPPDTALEGIFSKQEFSSELRQKSNIKKKSPRSTSDPGKIIEKAAFNQEWFGNSARFAELAGKERRAKIADTMRGWERAKLRDIQELFPGVSERTIRNDLQILTEGNIVERVGNTGPGTYYRLTVREQGASPSPPPASLEAGDTGAPEFLNQRAAGPPVGEGGWRRVDEDPPAYTKGDTAP